MIRLPPAQAWLTAPETLAVIDALEGAGGEARFVGGCVRNALLREPVADVDIATTLTPDRTMAALEAAGLKFAPTGVEHGTVTAISGRRGFEVTTLRRDVATDGRRAVVAFTTDWAEDAARRDFRLNALYADRTGEVFDPTGQGVEDCRAGRIVFVGEPEARIREDYLRILRFFRFHAWYGRSTPDAAGLAACADLKAGIGQLSAERISAELMKLLAAPDPVGAVRLMNETGVLEEALPFELDLPLFEAMVGLSQDPALRLSALLAADWEMVEAAAAKLRLSNALRDRLLAALPDFVEVRLGMDPHPARVAIYRLGRKVFIDRVMRAWAAEPGRYAGAWPLLDLAEAWTPPRFPIGGAELRQAGLEPGPRLGQVLRDLQDWWMARDFPEEGLDAKLAELIGAGA